MAEEKKPADFTALSHDHMEVIYGYLSSQQFIQMQLIKNDQRQWVQQKVKEQAAQIPDIKLEGVPDIKPAEKEIVWRIYECFRTLKDNNKPNPSYLPIPALPEPCQDIWVTLRTKRLLRELTLAEIHLLFIHGKLQREFVALCSGDPEKAALVTSSSFLQWFLSAGELMIQPHPPWYKRIGGALTTGLGNCFIAVLFHMARLFLYSFMLVVPLITIFIAFVSCPFAIVYHCVNGNGWPATRDIFRKIFTIILYLISFPIFSIAHVGYSLFAGIYYGGKFAIYKPLGFLQAFRKFGESTIDLDHSIGLVTKVMVNLGESNIKNMFKQMVSSLKTPSSWVVPMTISDIAAKSQRTKYKDKIEELQARIPSHMPAASEKKYYEEVSCISPMSIGESKYGNEMLNAPLLDTTMTNTISSTTNNSPGVMH